MRPGVCVLVALVLAGCGNAARPARVATRTDCTAGARTVAGATLILPPGARAGATPLVLVVVPGGQGDPGDTLGLRAEAARRGAALLYPTTPGGFWTLNARQGTAQPPAIGRLLDAVVAEGCVAPDRITATGVSNGAGFVARLACALPGRLRAIAPVAAGLKALDPCPAAARTSVLELHGGADTVVPFRGAKPDRRGSVPRWARAWAGRNGCATTPVTTHPARRITRTSYPRCPGGRRVEVRLFGGTDHGWPGAPPPFPRENPSGIDASPIVLAFLLGA